MSTTRHAGDAGSEQRPVLICYDGSRHGDAVIDAAADLFPGAHVEVLCIGSYGSDFITVPEGPISPFMPNVDPDRLDASIEASREEAQAMADAGAREARSKGLHATTRVEMTRGSGWSRIVAVADATPYAAVMIGSRGHSAIRTALLGGTSTGVAAHCTRPVVVVHGPEVPPLEIDIDERDIAEDLHLAGQ